MFLFGRGDLEEFLLFISYSNITLAATGTQTDVNIQYLCTLFHGELFRHFDLFSADVENMEILSVDCYIKGLASYLPL